MYQWLVRLSSVQVSVMLRWFQDWPCNDIATRRIGLHFQSIENDQELLIVFSSRPSHPRQTDHMLMKYFLISHQSHCTARRCRRWSSRKQFNALGGIESYDNYTWLENDFLPWSKSRERMQRARSSIPHFFCLWSVIDISSRIDSVSFLHIREWLSSSVMKCE